MNRIALGTAQFGLHYGIANQLGKVNQTEAGAMLELASRHGVDVIDTAVAYGDSEACLGELGVDRFRVVSKLPALPSDCADIAGWVDQQTLASCARLGDARLYGLLLHQPAQLLGPHGDAIFAALEQQRLLGRVQKIGVSVYSPNELDVLYPRFALELVQAPFNIVDRRLATSGWLARLAGAGIEVHTRSAFLQGLLLMAKAHIPSRFQRWAPLFAHWHRWLAEHDVSAVHACLMFTLAFPEISRVVVGADSIQQLVEILTALGPLPGAVPDLGSEAPELINPALWGTP